MQQIMFKGLDRRLAEFLLAEAERTDSDTIHMTHEQIAALFLKPSHRHHIFISSDHSDQQGQYLHEFSIRSGIRDRIRYHRIDPAVFRLRCIYPLQVNRMKQELNEETERGIS